jgi:glucosamine--fructose-6-phosphate aminotransferase (isomerizing)
MAAAQGTGCRRANRSRPERLVLAVDGDSVSHPTRLLFEVHEQPAALERLLTSGRAPLEALAAEMRRRQIAHVLIAARGTSDNAATYGKYLLGITHGLSVSLAAPSMCTLYGSPLRLSRDTMVLGVSQSGMSPDIVAVLDDARSQNVLTAAFVNAPGSRLAEAAEWVIPLSAGEERSVAATKSYTAQLMALAMLSAALSEDDVRWDELSRVPAAVRAALTLEDAISCRAERYCFMEHCTVISRGYNYATALETALKLKELTYTGTTPYSSADFLHGPVAVVREGYPVVTIACQGRAMASLREFVAEMRSRRAEEILVTDDADLARGATFPLLLPVTLPEWLSPIPAIIPGQLLGYYLALARGIDPERPRGLLKVTETR